MMSNKVCLLGAGSTKYGKLNESIIEIALNAAKDAVESAGITPKDIQAGYISNVFGASDKQVHMAPVVMSNLGIPYVPGLTIESACGSGSIMFREAYANIAAGFYDCVLALGVEKITHTGTTQSTTLFSYCSDFFYEGGNGATFPGLFASIARAYMTTHKANEEDLAYVAVKNHENGILNPKAHVRKEITVDDVLKSPVVASPLKLYDCCTISEIIDIEDLGFFQKGTAAHAVREGATKRNGEIPINTSGGLKSKGHPIGATGVGQVAEVFEQFTGKSGEREIKDAEYALTQNFGATGASCAVHIFSKVE